MQKPTLYLKNAMLLTISGFGLRAVGMLFRVWLAAWIGAEGMGLYQLALSVYNLAVTFATAGISVAATRLVAEELASDHPARAAGALRRVAGTGALLGLAAGALQFLAAYPASKYLLGDARAELSLRLLAPGLPFMAVAAALRGYFLARRKVAPSVESQTAEQLLRIALIAWLLRQVKGWGVGWACAAVMLGSTAGEIVSCLLMLLFWLRDRRSMPAGDRRAPADIAPRLWCILLPLEGSRCLASALAAAENVLVPACLALYTGSRAQALAQYGALKGMALPVLFFPFSILGALATLLLPEITEAHIRGGTVQLQNLLSRMLLLTATFSVLGGGLFTLYAQPLGRLLYGSGEVGLYLMVLGPLTPLMYLESMVDGALKGMGQQMATFRYSLQDSVLRILLILLALPRFGIGGFLGVMAFSNAFTCLMNLHRLLDTAGLRFDWLRWALRPLACLAPALGLAWGVSGCTAPWGTLVQIGTGGAAGALAYLALMWPGALKPALCGMRSGRQKTSPQISDIKSAKIS